MMIKKLNPNWITGFTDAEGCFYIRISQSKTHKIGWKIQVSFEIGLYAKDKDLLYLIRSYFKRVGTIV